jgi:hypothetical protein
MREIQGAEGATQSLNYVGGPSGAPSESSYRRKTIGVGKQLVSVQQLVSVLFWKTIGVGKTIGVSSVFNGKQN